ncbi:transcription initiation factor TFIID subunit 4b isoform X2 [Argentina anserina]|uniref:transcription initiation factor TFIID subunit 4b isoform X2 n=1 Tax=Argentina anserina TaxID=57926 RepID=UPI0021762D4A|nr:transcription initiation factor TFIID subunit 4b isoform X2 [Potentilla anserina]
MDPSMMKKLLEDDEDETMHSGADVEAFQAALNRDIEGDLAALQPSDSESAVLSQGSNNTSSQSLSQLHTANQDESTVGQIQHDQNIAQQRELHSYEMELKQQQSISENMPQQNDASQELNHFSLPQKQPHGDLQQGQADQKPLQTGMLMSGKHPVSTQEQNLTPKPENDSQYAKLQKMSSQQAMPAEQPSTPMNRSKQVPFGLLLPVLLPQLDKDRAMQLQTLFTKLKNNEISKDAFVRHIRSVVGDQMLKMAVYKVQTQQPALKQHLMTQASSQQQSPRMPSINAGATQFTGPRSFAIQQRGVNPSTNPSHIPTVHMQTDSSHSAIENSAKKLREAERQSDPHGMQVNQMSASSTGASNQERERSSVPMQVHNKQQQQLHYPQSSFAMYGSTGSNYHPYPETNVNTMPLKQQPHDPHLRQIPQHQSMGSAQSGGGEAQGTNIMSVPKSERQNSVNEPSRQQGGSLPHFTNSSTLQQNSVPWQSSNKEQISGPISSMGYVKQESIDQSAEQQHKTGLSNSQRLPYASSVQLEHGNVSPGIAVDESLEKQSSRMRSSSTGPSGSIVASSSTSTGPVLNPVSSTTTTHTDPNLGSRIPSGTSPSGITNRIPAKKASVGQKKPNEALGSPPPPSSGKKQKVSGGFSDQSIEQLNDVTAVSGVNLREEEEQLFSGPKDDTRASEASRRVVQEEEERLILQKHPLQKKLAEIMFRNGLKSISHDVERCLSLCVEERMRGLINNLIRLSKQRVDAEKPKHYTIITSDVQQQIMIQNKKAKEEWEKKQAEAEKVRKLNEPETINGVDGDKDDGRSKSFKVNKEEDDKMRTTAANVAARAAVGGDDMLSKWQLMAEQARQKREGGSDVASGSQPGKDVNRKPTSAAGRIMKDNPEGEKRGAAAPVSAAGTVRKFGKNQVMVPQMRVARSISVKDVISVLEREPQMSKSPLIYRLYERNQSDSAGE